MKNYLFNIIIPSIEIDRYIDNCLEKLEKQKYKNFFVSLILDKKAKLKKKYKYKINLIISKKINMSYKRNVAAKKYKSDYLAFLDSDAYPNIKWLENANLLYNINPNEVLGGPNIHFPNENASEMLSYYCKRSFFVNGHLAYRKYLSKDKYINDFLESCNFFISRKKFLKIGGMNKHIYIGEDQNFFKKLREKTVTNIFFTKKLYVFHKDRNIFNFLKQRFCFGMDVFSGVDFSNGLKGIAVLLPFFLVSSLLIFINLPISFEIKLNTLIYFSLFFILAVLFEINNFLKRKKLIIFVLISIIFSNILYGVAGIVSLIGLRSFFEKKIYRQSR